VIVDDTHALDAITGPNEALRARCTCGYSTPPVHDKRTAVQAHQQHRKEASA
jgi:hypothetical protein